MNVASFIELGVVIEEWSPRMDVAESGKRYVLTVEIPGVSAKDIKVEVNERKYDS